MTQTLIKHLKQLIQRIRIELAYRKALKNNKDKDPFIY